MASFTKKAIRDSFVKLLNEKSLSQITIRDIVDDCGVNRNTFYYYSQDLPQLVESIVDEDAERIIRGASYHRFPGRLYQCSTGICSGQSESGASYLSFRQPRHL